MKKFLLFVMSAVVSTASFAQLELAGVLDLGLSSNSGKAVHLRATAAIADLSTYGIGVANNGGGTDGVEYVFPAAAVAAGDEILVVRDSLAMASYFGSCFGSWDHVFVDPGSSISQNGDDAIELFLGTTVIETFGDINVDGTGQPWEYLDSWAYKVSGNWTYGGVSCTAGSLLNDTSSCPYPFCPLPPANITFQVDLSTYTGTFGAAYVNGDFNGWCGTCNPMTDANGDGIWDVTLPLNADSIEYKFTLDGWTVDETLVAGTPCTKTSFGFTNRFLIITGDATLPAVCWESCTSCSATQVSDVTFQLDMSTYTGAFTTPYVSGQFNGWCGNCNPLSDADGDNIWEATVTISGDSTEYKFQVDNWAADEALTPGSSCTKTTSGFTNRFIVLNGNVTLPAVCWASCSGCAPAVCTGEEVVISVTTDNYGSETTWALTDVNSGTVLASGGPYADFTIATYNDTVCVPTGTLVDFVIYDTWGDGLFDGTNTGSYDVSIDCSGSPFSLTSGSGAFAYGGGASNTLAWDSAQFNVQCAPPSCDDVFISVTTDNYGSETTWALTDVTSGTVLASGGPYSDFTIATYNDTVCVPTGTLVDFVIYDTWGDGLFDGINTGSYDVSIDCGGSPFSLTSGSGAFAYGGGASNTLAWDSAQFNVQCPATGCPITTVPTTTDGVTCGPNGATLTAVAGTPQNYIIWADSSVSIVGQGTSVTAPAYPYDYTFTAHEAFPAASAPTLNGPPSATITMGGFGNFSNGMYFSAQSFFRWDSVTVQSNGDVSGFIVIRDSNPSQNPNAKILQFTPFSVTGAGFHTIPVDLTIAPGSYYANVAFNTGITGQLFRATAGASYPYTVTNVMSVDSAWLGAGSSGNLARVYYFFDWQVTEVCVSAGTPATAFYSSGSSATLPYNEDFESGIPCDWTLTQNAGSAGWLGGDSATLSSQFWSIPAHTNFAASNDDACNCDMANDLMISHQFDFSTQGALNDLQLAFDYYFDGTYGSTGTFWYTSQGGPLTLLDSLAANTAWATYTKDINFLAGSDSVVFIFKHDDGGVWASGVAVDNFSITNNCAGENVTVSITTDSWGSETTWSLTDATTGAVLASGGPYPDGVIATYTTDICAPAGATVDFVINDSYGDGLYDGVNTGNYSVDIDCGGSPVTLTSGSGAFAYGGPSGSAPSYDSAQFVLTCPPPACDDFESYTTGDFVSQSADWNGWDNAAQDAVVSTAQANSGTQSIHINTLGSNGYSDIVREFGGATTGVHEVALSFYVASTDGGYFNLMHDYNVGGPNTWAIEVYLDGTAGSGVIQYGSASTATIGTFGFTADAWNDIVFVIDLDSDWAEAWVNGSPIVGWQWSAGNTGVYNAFDAVNLYSAAPAGLSSNMYVDDFCFQASTRVPVTFQVDMSQETVSADGVHVAGDFQGWNPGVTRMSDNGTGVYSYTSYLLPNDTYEFKFVNGNAWGTDESVPSACAQNNNRFVQVGAAATTTPLVCFGSCTTCGTAQVAVTFQVDMSEETVSADGVHLAGEFQGWDPAATAMTDQGNGVWAVTIDLDPNSTYEYKFVNGNAWGTDESVPAACAQNNNRFVQVGASNQTIPLVCFGSCIECQIGVEENALAQSVALYPNPSNGIVNFDFSFDAPTDVAITVYNTLGHVVAEIQESSMTAGTSRVDATQWASGIYTVRISGMNETMIRQLVIQR